MIEREKRLVPESIPFAFRQKEACTDQWTDVALRPAAGRLRRILGLCRPLSCLLLANLAKRRRWRTTYRDIGAGSAALSMHDDAW